MIGLLVTFAFCAQTPSQDPARGDWDSRYRSAQERYYKSQAEANRNKSFAENLTNPAEKAKAMEAAQKAALDMQKAKADMDEAGKHIKPVEKPEEEKGRGLGDNPSMDPRVSHHSWVGEPGKTGGLDTNRPNIPTPNVPTTIEGAKPYGVIYTRPPAKPGPSGSAGKGGRVVVVERRPAPAPGPADPAPPPPKAEPFQDMRPPERLPRDFQPVDFVRDVDAWEFSLFQPGRVPEVGVRGRMKEERITGVRRALDEGRDAEALAQADELLEMSPDDPRVWLLKALILCRMGRFAEAVEAAQGSIRLRPESAKAYETLALALASLERYEEAAAAASKAIALDPKAALAYAIRALAHEKLGVDSADDVKQAAALRPRLFQHPSIANPITPLPLRPPLREDGTETGEKASPLPWAMGGATLLVLGGGGWFYFKRKRLP